MKPTRLGSKILIGDSAASTFCSGDYVLFHSKRPPIPDDKYLLNGNGKKMEVEGLGFFEVWMPCAKDVGDTLRNAAFVLGYLSTFAHFNVIQ